MSVSFTLRLNSDGDLVLEWCREDGGLRPATGEWTWHISDGDSWPSPMQLLTYAGDILTAARANDGRLTLVGGLHGGTMRVGRGMVTEIDGKSVTKWEEWCLLHDLMQAVFPTYRMEAAA